ncbi:MAG: hypothetical protein GF329_19420 [Candidatus Lokiarchaeota archaeon]|nr:hypothetical protein [Candidatus Lokiarchaeota archaeon]
MIIKKEKRRKILAKLITGMGAEILENDYIIVKKEGLVFKIYFWGNIVYAEFIDCMGCELDCSKEIQIEFRSNINLWGEYEDLEQEDISRLGKIYTLINETEKIDIEQIKERLRTQLGTIRFIILGLDIDLTLNIFKEISASEIKLSYLNDSRCKVIETFPELMIDLCLLSESAINNFISDRPAPILIDFLKDIYGFIVLSDSTSVDVSKIKNKILPKIRKHNPFALCLIFALHYGEKNTLSPNLMEKILNKKVYEIPKEKELQAFMEILYKSTLLRMDQMREEDCEILDH